MALYKQNFGQYALHRLQSLSVALQNVGQYAVWLGSFANSIDGVLLSACKAVASQFGG